MEIILTLAGVTFGSYCVWAVVRVANEPQRWRTYFGPIGAVFGLVLVAALFLPAVRDARPAARRTQCLNNLKNIALALHNYHDKFGSFPPAYIADANGKPMHSWRVLLLPYLDQKELYERYRLDEPWDGPSNRKLADLIVGVYNCPGGQSPADESKRTATSYVAVVGPATMWPGDRSTELSDIKDGTSNTLMVVEIANSGIHWMEPRDLHVSQMAPTINAQSGQGISSLHSGVANVAFADGRVRALFNTISADLLQALLTINGNDNQAICDDF